VANLASATVAPILSVGYLVVRSDWSQSTADDAQRGRAVVALANFFLSSAVTGSVFSDGGVLPMGSALTTAIT
jgi:hypothetical protein